MWTLLRKIVVSILVIKVNVEDRDEHDKPIMEQKYIESHFDFKLNGNINGEESGKQNDFALLCIVMS